MNWDGLDGWISLAVQIMMLMADEPNDIKSSIGGKFLLYCEYFNLDNNKHLYTNH